ncbi:MAG: serine/threonine-protein kinase [bacterium]
MTLTLDAPDAPATEHTVRDSATEARVAPHDIQEGVVCTRCWQVAPTGDPAACATCGAPRPPRGWAQMPYRLNDRYRFNRLLGRGAMGAVFLAIDAAAPLDAQGQAVARAVKVVQRLEPEHLARSMLMFEHEAAAAGLLGRSPAFVRIFGYDTGSEPYLVMECVRWPTLAKTLRAGPLSSAQTARLGVALLEALEIMHYHRMIHRDLKPSNLFVHDAAGDWRVKIADLGIWIGDADAGAPPALHGDDRYIHGTVPYMSPEQMTGNTLGPRSDLHAIASILWECVTGEVPFPVDEREDPATQVARRRAEVRLQPDRPSAMTPALHRVLFRALALRPEDRPQSARAMLDALRAAAEAPVVPGGVLTAAEQERVALEARLAEIRAKLGPQLDAELAARAIGIERGLALLADHLRRADITERAPRKLIAAVRADLIALAAAADDPYHRADQRDPTAPNKNPAALPPTAPIQRPGADRTPPPSTESPPTLAPTAPVATPAPAPDPIDRYVITALAGAGSTARVYHATHRTLDRPVALRVMYPEGVADLGADPAAFFRARARAAARLDHPHILAVYDHDTGADGLPFVVEPLLEGETLLARLKHRRVLDPHEITTLARPLASALATAHAARVLHLNLKPDRVVLKPLRGLPDHPVLYGFGFDQDDIADHLAPDALYGTPAYMAPEQSQGHHGPAADIYALGTILFRLVTGLLPYWGNTIDAVLTQKRQDPAPALPARNARGLDVPEPLRRLVADMLHLDPRARPDAATLSQRLASLDP